MSPSLSIPLLAASPLAVLLLASVVRPMVARPSRTHVDRLLLAILATKTLASLGWLVASRADSPVTLRVARLDLFGVESALGLVFRFDRVSLVVSATVGAVAWAVYRYSLRYLDGEARNGRFLGWLGFTIASVESLVLAGHLVQLAASWMMVSTGLHFLLVHYADRPAAVRAARRKFLVSRLGDVGLVFAIVVLARSFGTLDLGSLVAAAQDAAAPDRTVSLSIAGFGFALAALCKSAQFPMHGWLPDTLEAPTPVSALMHAGVVNAGGYLLIRTSALLANADGALACLAVFGIVTACFGSLVASTQTEVKKALAWSTVAQMGFMILQCGLGAMVAALVHLVGHSVYKAHAFLASGTLPVAVGLPRPAPPPSLAIGRLALGTGIGFAVLASCLVLLGHSPAQLPGGLTLLGLGALGLGSLLVPGTSMAPSGMRIVGLVALSALAACITHAAHVAFAVDVGSLVALEQRGASGRMLAAAVWVVAAGTAVLGACLAWWTSRGEGLGLYLVLRRGSALAPVILETFAELVDSRRRAGAAQGREA